jgi:hypothetical protein
VSGFSLTGNYLSSQAVSNQVLSAYVGSCKEDELVAKVQELLQRRGVVWG